VQYKISIFIHPSDITLIISMKSQSNISRAS